MAREGSEPQRADRPEFEQHHYVFACSYTRYPSPACAGDRAQAEGTFQLFQYSPMLMVSFSKNQQKMQRAEGIQDKIHISLLTCQINSNGLRQQCYFYFLIS